MPVLVLVALLVASASSFKGECGLKEIQQKVAGTLQVDGCLSQALIEEYYDVHYCVWDLQESQLNQGIEDSNGQIASLTELRKKNSVVNEIMVERQTLQDYHRDNIVSSKCGSSSAH